ncbi:MAG: GH92 family glycosyl hydrolase [Armatimonadota bacterium]
MPVTNDVSPLDLVNTLQGSNSEFRFSRGNCLPLVAMPFGMTHWCPQTNGERNGWFFHPDDPKLEGIRATHQPSPWIGDYGHFVVMPQTGERKLGARERSSVYRSEGAAFQPHYFSADLLRYNCTVELTPTERCAVLRCHFPVDTDIDPFDAAQTRRLIFEPFTGVSEVEILPEQRQIRGLTRTNSGGTPPNFALYFVITLDAPIEAWGLFEERAVFPDETIRTGSRVGAYAEFAPGELMVEARIATSFISIEQAERNLQQETGGLTFDEIKARGEAVWDESLSRIRIEGGTDDQRRTFYSCLYRTQLFPRIFHEIGDDGAQRHYSPYDGNIHDGPMYTDNGFWDTYRTVYPLYSLLCPERLGEILQGWVNVYKESGWFPTWASPGHRSCMVGTHADAVIADAIVKNIPGFDVATAYQGIRKHALEDVPEGSGFGREGLTEFIEKGYVSSDHFHAATSRTLDYAYDDFCISQAARALGHEEDADQLTKRSRFWRNVYDPAVGMMRGRNSDGSWRTPWDQFEWGGPFVEGGTWQHSWGVPHDPAGLIATMGGREAFTAKLDQMLALPPHFRVGSYGFEIHEMTEMASADFGQYAHSNQPVHHALYLFTCAGQPHKTQRWVRRVLTELYSSESFPADEDNGEMASWYVLSALGLYPLCPGHPSYVFSSPLFPAAHLSLPQGKTLTIRAKTEGEQDVIDAPYTKEIAWNGATWSSLSIGHDELIQGGELSVVLSDTPDTSRRFTSDQLPFSVTPYREDPQEA